MLIRNGMTATGGSVAQADVRIEGGAIIAIGERLERAAGEEVLDAGGCYVIPGGIDPHVHVTIGGRSLNEEMLDDLEEASRCALFGGVTTLGVYVQGAPGMRLLDAVREEIDYGEKASYTDFFVNALCLPGDDVEEAVEDGSALGIASYKAFLGYFGRGRMLEDDALMALMRAAARHNCTVLVHAESGRVMDYLEAVERESGDLRDAERLLRTAPAEVEAEGITRAGLFARLAGCRLLFVHMTSALGLAAFEWVREVVGADRVLVETQPHYALLSNDAVVSRGALAKIGPPLKGSADADAVRGALVSGMINHLSSDHSPRMSAVKLAKPDILDAPYGGISGTELLLPLAVELAGGLDDGAVSRAVRLCSAGAAQAFGLYPRKGVIAVGADGDVVVIPKDASARKIGPEWLHGRSDYSLYSDLSISAVPRFVVKGGITVIADGELIERPTGRFLVPSFVAPTSPADVEGVRHGSL